MRKRKIIIAMEDFWVSNSDDFTNIYENSERIFFSGKYGIGKTTYLKNFFNKEEHKNTFPIHIFPVNYAIEKNENILNLLKYDILYALVLKDTLQNRSIPINKKETKIKDYVIENADKLFIKFLQTLPKIGKYVKDIESKWIEIKKDFESFSNEEFENSKLDEFIQKIEQKEGSIYENDFITSLINKKLNHLKNNDIKPVLILDDIDRIEPVHIFRILNVFASLYDDNNYKSNKFDFSKVIIVGDIFNIQSVYHHIYGYNADFDGYIDKFYSDQIYYLSFRESLKSQITKFNFNQSYFVTRLVSDIIIILFDNKKLNFRQLRLIQKLINDLPTEIQSLKKILKLLSIFYLNDLNTTIKYLKEINIDFSKRYYLDGDFFEFLLKFMIFDYNNINSSKIKMAENDSTLYLFYFENTENHVSFKIQESIREKRINLQGTHFDKSNLIWQEFKHYLNNIELFNN